MASISGCKLNCVIFDAGSMTFDQVDVGPV